MNLKDFLQLAGKQGKVVVMGEDGNVKGVFLSFDEYQKLSGNNFESASVVEQESVAEKANKEILQAQLEEVISMSDGGTAANRPQLDLNTEEDITEALIDLSPPERIDSVLSKRAQELFKSIPFDPTQSPHRDFRTPEVASTSDEEISTNFDDI